MEHPAGTGVHVLVVLAPRWWGRMGPAGSRCSASSEIDANQTPGREETRAPARPRREADLSRPHVFGQGRSPGHERVLEQRDTPQGPPGEGDAPGTAGRTCLAACGEPGACLHGPGVLQKEAKNQ